MKSISAIANFSCRRPRRVNVEKNLKRKDKRQCPLSNKVWPEKAQIKTCSKTSKDAKQIKSKIKMLFFVF